MHVSLTNSQLQESTFSNGEGIVDVIDSTLYALQAWEQVTITFGSSATYNPFDEASDLPAAQVYGDAMAKQNGKVILENALVQGKVDATGNGTIGATNTRISGNVSAADDGVVTLTDVRVEGQVNITGPNARVRIKNSTIAGGVQGTLLGVDSEGYSVYGEP